MAHNETREIANNEFWEEEEAEVANGLSVHPGLVLKNNILPKRGLTAAALADVIGVARPGMNNMLNGKRELTPEMALKIGAALDYPADALLVMMANCGLARARAQKPLRELVDQIAAAAKLYADNLGEIKVANENRKIRQIG